MLTRNRYLLLHGQNNTKKITAVARTKHEDNCCFTDKKQDKEEEEDTGIQDGREGNKDVRAKTQSQTNNLNKEKARSASRSKFAQHTKTAVFNSDK